VLGQSIRNVVTSNPRTVDAEKSLAYAAKVMREEDVGVAPKQVVTIDPQQDLVEALRIMAKHDVRRLAVVEEGGKLVGVVAQGDVAREGDDRKTGKLVEEIPDSGG
jgi:CBS domain-containing protein